MEDKAKASFLTLALIAAAQRVEHYEMADYGSVREFARMLGQQEMVALLDATLAE